MIQSSLLIRVVLAIFTQLDKWYEGSLIHRIFTGLGQGLVALAKGSALLAFFTKFDLYILVSTTYRIFRGIFRALNTLIKWVRIRLVDRVQKAKVHEFLQGISRIDMGLSLFGLLSLGFGLGLVIIYMLTKRTQGLVGLAFALLGCLSLGLSQGAHGKLENSRIIGLVSSLHHLFLPDEEGESWKY